MANIPGDLTYTADHEYIRQTTDPLVVVVGITDYAQDQLGDIVFIELPRVGATFAAHDTVGTIEAVKAVSELFSPVAGEIVEVNTHLDADPSAVNRDPYGDGWMIKMRVASPAAGLMDAAGYTVHVAA